MPEKHKIAGHAPDKYTKNVAESSGLAVWMPVEGVCAAVCIVIGNVPCSLGPDSGVASPAPGSY